MHRLVGRATPALLGLAVVAVFLGHLLAAGAILVVRDVPIFHVPLRQAFAGLAAEGLPVWNPSIHSGQPILSNPNYAAFYPPSWLALVLPAQTAVSWILFLHGLLAFAGAWVGARGFGCGRAAAALTALAFVAGGGLLSAVNGVTTYCSASWIPWTLHWGRRSFEASDESRLDLRAALPGLALAIQLLAGEPAIALASSVAIVCLALGSRGRPARRARRLVTIAVFAVLFSAVQLLPTLHQVRNSSRAQAAGDDVGVWSTSPLRLVELAYPRLFGDPMGLDEDRYFGWNLHDRNYPYLISIYAGQLVLILALAGLIRWPIRGRRFWILLALAGVVLALGRYNPLSAVFENALPVFGLIRYPEKFLILTTTALAFAAGLGWQHLLERRGQRMAASEDFAIALGAVMSLVALVLALTVSLTPELAPWFVAENTLLPPVGERLELAVAFLKRQAWVAVAAAFSALLIVALHRLRRVPVALLVPLTLAGLGLDLAYYNRGLTPTIPYQELATPPDHLEKVDPNGGRVFTDEPFIARDRLQPRSNRPGPDALWSKVDRAEPYLGNLWGYSYALNRDFDRMLTEPAGRSLDLVRRHWSDLEVRRRILASWGVGYVLRNRSAAELTHAQLAGQAAPAVEVEFLPRRNPLLSWERSVTWHSTPAAAEAAAAANRFRGAHWIGRAKNDETMGGAPETIHRLAAASSAFSLDYTSSSVLLAVINTTFDRGWLARLDGDRLGVHQTVLGQIALELPPGRHSLSLRFRTPLLGAGLAITLLTGLAVLTIQLRRRRASR